MNSKSNLSIYSYELKLIRNGYHCFPFKKIYYFSFFRTSNAGATYAIPISISVVVIIAMVATVIVKRKQIRQKCFQGM